MALLDISFPWPVCTSGYETSLERRRVIVTDEPVSSFTEEALCIRPRGQRTRIRYPLHNISLYLEFAGLDGSPEACVAFANRFGLLTEDGEKDGEPLSIWKTAISQMARRLNKWTTDPLTLTENFSAGVALTPVPPAGKLGLRLRPLNLLNGMQLQLAASIAAGNDLRSCAYCAQLFEVGPTGKRSQAKFCSSKCQNDFNNAKKLRRSA